MIIAFNNIPTPASEYSRIPKSVLVRTSARKMGIKKTMPFAKQNVRKNVIFFFNRLWLRWISIEDKDTLRKQIA